MRPIREQGKWLLLMALLVSVAGLLTGWGVAWSTADEPKPIDLGDLRAAIQAADRRGVNVADIAQALERLDKALKDGLKVQPGQAEVPAELQALRDAVEMAARKGENVDEIRQELAAVEKRLLGRTLVAERPPMPQPQPEERPRPGIVPPGGGFGFGGGLPFDGIGPGMFGPLGGKGRNVDRELFDKAQELRMKALRMLMENPNDAEAIKLIEELMQLMLKALNPEGPIEFFGFPGLPLGDLEVPNNRVRLGVRMERVPELLSEQLGLEMDRGVVIVEVLPNTPAEKAGFKPNDIVIEFAGKPVPNNPERFAQMVQEVKAGEKVAAVVLRKGKRVELQGIELPEQPQRDAREPRIRPRRQVEPLPPRDNPPPDGIEFGGGGAFPGPVPPFGDVFPDLPFGGGFGGPGRSVSFGIINGDFVLKVDDNGVEYVITGRMHADDPIDQIVIRDGKDKITADSLDKVPAKYRPVLEEVLKQYRILPDRRGPRDGERPAKPNRDKPDAAKPEGARPDGTRKPEADKKDGTPAPGNVRRDGKKID